MNRQRRKKLAEAVELLNRANEIISNVLDEEQEAFDNLSEGLQETERGQQMSDYIDTLTEAQDNSENDRDALDEIVNG